MNEQKSRWMDAMTAACLLAVGHSVVGGIRLRAAAGPVRDAWLECLKRRLGADQPVRRITPGITDDGLLGGLDLAATLEKGVPVGRCGLLATAHQGVVLVAMAERCSSSLAARIGAVIDDAEVRLEREGIAARWECRFGLVALDEGEQDESPPEALLDRLSIHLDLSHVSVRDLMPCSFSPSEVAAARKRFPTTHISEAMIRAIAAAALASGVCNMRASLFACQIARASAALFAREDVSEDDASLAARLVFSPRARRVPEIGPEEAPPPESRPSATDNASSRSTEHDGKSDSRTSSSNDVEMLNSTASARDQPKLAPDEVVIAAVAASIPEDLLNQLRCQDTFPRPKSVGRCGLSNNSGMRGRPIGTSARPSARGQRPDVIATLRAAAPWQSMRRSHVGDGTDGLRSSRVLVNRQDFRYPRFLIRSQTTTIFAVDASGSAALHRLAEAKGAVELMLSQCYIRRDQVAVLGFRDRGAVVILPPTRSLVRARRSLAGMAAGGGTPLAAAIDAVTLLVQNVQRRGEHAMVVFLSDGRANVALDLSRDRQRAQTDAVSAAQKLRRLSPTALFLDTSKQANPSAALLAGQMGGRYLALPHADARRMSLAIVEAAS